MEGRRSQAARGFVLDPHRPVDVSRGEVARRLLSTPPAHIAVPTVVVSELETGIAQAKDAVQRCGPLDPREA